MHFLMVVKHHDGKFMLHSGDIFSNICHVHFLFLYLDDDQIFESLFMHAAVRVHCWTLRIYFASNEIFYRRLLEACTSDIWCLSTMQPQYCVVLFDLYTKSTRRGRKCLSISNSNFQQFLINISNIIGDCVIAKYIRHLDVYSHELLSRLLDNIALYYVMSSRIESAICGLLYPVSAYSIALYFLLL